MIQTKRLTIGGYSFNVEADAEKVLENYLSDIRRNTAGNGGELTKDVESRIAELLLQKCGSDRVVNLSLANWVKEVIGAPETFRDESDETAPGEDSTASTEKRHSSLFRDVDHRILGGVCSGLAQKFDIDVIFLRLGFALLVIPSFFFHLFAAIPITLYMVLWVCMPPNRKIERSVYDDKPIRTIEKEMRTSPFLKGIGTAFRVLVGVILVALGVLILGFFIPVLDPETPMQIRDAFSLGETPIRSVMILLIICIFLASIELLYLGVMLIFNLTPPAWRPGLVVFIAWVLTILTGFAIIIYQRFSLGMWF